jgi:hypothetical protein
MRWLCFATTTLCLLMSDGSLYTMDQTGFNRVTYCIVTAIHKDCDTVYSLLSDGRVFYNNRSNAEFSYLGNGYSLQTFESL